VNNLQMGSNPRAPSLADNATIDPFGFRCVARRLNADMNSVVDQALTVLATGRFSVEFAIAVWKSGGSAALSTGGIFTGASGAGSVVCPSTLWSGVTGTGKWQQVVLTSDYLTNPAMNFFLTVAAGSASTADIFVYGTTFDY
jgi:hypothetical protein